jgi:hypothetical protein
LSKARPDLGEVYEMAEQLIDYGWVLISNKQKNNEIDSQARNTNL